MKVLVTGGAGFVGHNLIKQLKLQNPSWEISSLDNYFTGKEENHQSGVTYYRGHTWEADTILKNESFDIVYHFGEYSRIVQSFRDIDFVHRSILSGTPIILELCREWGAKLIYSASSSKFGNEGKDENLSPYSWMKSKMVELIKNYGKWYDLQYEICYFFNVYGPGQITKGDYATVVGIFERQYKEDKKCTVVTPGTQTRDFTHINDIVSGLIKASSRMDNSEWHLRSGINVSIINVAEMFGEWELIPERRGERFTSEEFPSDTEMKLNWKPEYNLQDWINSSKEK
jgi:UDP-glucose 4-epimerase|tara:strand:- start:1891 stop:2748 length:858 start_codon:yes stop_codon:yes gene_type:complete